MSLGGTSGACEHAVRTFTPKPALDSYASLIRCPHGPTILSLPHYTILPVLSTLLSIAMLCSNKDDIVQQCSCLHSCHVDKLCDQHNRVCALAGKVLCHW